MIDLIHPTWLRRFFKLMPSIWFLALLSIGCTAAAPATDAPGAAPLPTSDALVATQETPAPRSPIPEPTPAQVLGSINGWVWHDDCTDGMVNPATSCVADDNPFRGNGLMEADEPPIGGVKVMLGLGACPATGFKETTTIANDLSYSFIGLEAGTYCVSIDPNQPNADILLPGAWTFPSATDGLVSSTVDLAAGENKFDVNFGWDKWFPPSEAQACTDSAAYMSDVTIPDNTIVPANSAFTKTWRVKNTGTCTWDSSYLVAYISGTPMSQQPGYWIVPEGQTVAPNQTIDISVGMTAPVDSGSYASYWGLKEVDGQFMPIHGGANGNSFYVKIRVNDGAGAGNVTAQSISIELEQGSSAVCTANSTYFVHASITADGPTTATYEIGSTAGQIAAGNFETTPGGSLTPYITGTVVFNQAGTQTINLRFVGPYPYPDDITVILRINGGEWHNTRLSCQ